MHLPREELLDVVRRTGLLAQRKSPLRLRFEDGRAHRLGADAGRRRGARVAAGRLRRRAARDRLQRGVPARRARVGDGRDRAAEADQPAAAGAAPRRERRLPLPDHADPARRLIVARASLRSFRSYAAPRPGPRAGARARRRAERRRQDEPARGAPRRRPGVLAANARGPRARALRRAGRAASRSRGREAGAPVETEVTIAPGEGKQLRLNGAPLAGAEELRAAPDGARLRPRPARRRQGRPGRPPRLRRPDARARLALAGSAAGRVRPGARAAKRGPPPRPRRPSRRRDAVEPWTEQVAALGTELDAARADARRGARARLRRARRRPRARRRRRSATSAASSTVADLEARLDARSRARDDRRSARTSATSRSRAGDRDLRSFGSQGEQRTAVLALLLAEAAVLAERRGAPPLLLLDDVFSELDAGRRRRCSPRSRPTVRR